MFAPIPVPFFVSSLLWVDQQPVHLRRCISLLMRQALFFKQRETEVITGCEGSIFVKGQHKESLIFCILMTGDGSMQGL